MSVAIDAADAELDKEEFDAECTTETGDERPVETGFCDPDNPICFTYTSTS